MKEFLLHIEPLFIPLIALMKTKPTPKIFFFLPRSIILICLCLPIFNMAGQVGINNTNPNATLDVRASNVSTPANTDGILIPRADEFPLTNPTAFQDGMILFITGAGVAARGFYFWDHGTIPAWVAVSNGSGDVDWYEEGTTTVPNSISDNMYTQGNVSLGASTNILNSHLNIETDPLLNSTSISNSILGTSSGLLKGIANYFNLGGSANIQGVLNSVGGTGSGDLTAVANTFSNNSALGLKTGLKNTFQSFSRGSGIGVHNRFESTFTSSAYGIQNEFIEAGPTSTIYGLSNVFVPTLDVSNIYGTYTSINAGVSDSAYGYYAAVTTTGTDYGIYSSTANNAIDFAAYFIGRTSLGNTTTNRYIMPAADGTAGQVMLTDGAGNLSFQAVPGDGTGTDDQNLTLPTISGTTLNLNIEGGTGTAIDLAPIQDGTGTDDQSINAFGLSGDTLGISLEDDGQPVQTVDLSNLSFNVNNFALAKMTMSANQTVPGWTATKLNFDTAAFDLGSNFNTATDRFEVTETGYYRITASFRSNIPYTTTDYYQLYVSTGTVVKRDERDHHGSGFVMRFVQTIEYITAGQYVEASCFATGSGGLVLSASTQYTTFEVERIR